MRMVALLFAAVVALVSIQKGLGVHNSGPQSTRFSLVPIDELQMQVRTSPHVMMVEDHI